MTGIILLVLMAAAPIVMMSGGDDAEDMDMEMDGDNVEETMPPDTNTSNDLVGDEDGSSDEEDRPVGPVHLADINGGSEDDAEQDVNLDTNSGNGGDPEPEEDPQPEPEPEPEPDGNPEEDPNPVPTNEERLTGVSDTYNGDLFTRHIIHLDGGNDIASGGALNDIFEGGQGSDIIAGKGGNDVLFATDSGAGSASDSNSDRLDGGMGDDTLVFGDQDVATGGEGNDTFKIKHDTLLYTVITDFDATADMILIEAEDPANLDVAFQMITSDGLIVTLTNGAVVLLEGETQEVGSDRLAIVGIQPTI